MFNWFASLKVSVQFDPFSSLILFILKIFRVFWDQDLDTADFRVNFAHYDFDSIEI